MTLKPLVTVVTPTYNRAAYIEKTIMSVLNQTYQNIEYIVVDDGSTDNTAEILHRFSGRIKVITQKNRGQSNALNAGWAVGRGHLLTYLSSDDLLENIAIEYLVREFYNVPGVVLVYPNYQIIDSHGKIVGACNAPEYDEQKFLTELVCPIGVCPLFSRAAFEAVGGWSRAFRQINDVEYWFRLSKVGGFRRVNAFLAYYRIHDQSSTYKKMTVRRSFEVLCLVKHAIRSGDKRIRPSVAQGYAYLIACRNNLQSERYLLGVRLLAIAVARHPALIVHFRFYKTILQGFRLIVFRFIGRI